MPVALPETVFAFLKRLHDELQPLSTQIIFDRQRPLHLYLITHYGTLLELTGAIILLVNKRQITGVPVLLRSVLEGYVDLHNLVEKPDYQYALELSYIKQWLHILNTAKTGQNDYLRAITSAADLDATISERRKTLAALERDGHRELSIKEKFQWADMDMEYRSLYNALCCSSHNNLRALIDRHLPMDNGEREVVIYKASMLEDSAVYIGTNAELLVRASQKIHAFFMSPVESSIATYRTELDTLRG